MVTGQVSCKRQQEAKLALIQCRVVKIDIQECSGGSQTKTRDSIFVYTFVTGDNFTFILWRAFVLIYRKPYRSVLSYAC